MLVEIEIDAICAHCGSDLRVEQDGSRLRVEPCEECKNILLQDSYQDGLAKGEILGEESAKLKSQEVSRLGTSEDVLKNALSAAHDDGYREGFEKARAAAHDVLVYTKHQAYKKGYEAGRESGYNIGFEEGARRKR